MKKHLLHNIIFKAATAFLSFIFMVMLGRILGVNENGDFNFFIANVNILFLLFGLSIESGINYFVANKSISVNKIFYSVIVFVLIQSVLCFFFNEIWLNIFGNYFYLHNYNYIVPYGMFLFIAFILNTALGSMLMGLHLFKQNNLQNFIFYLLNISVLFILYNAHLLTLKICLFTYIIISYIPIVYSIFILYNNKFITSKIEWISTQDFINLKKYIQVYALINFIQILAFRIDYWIVNYYHGKQALGIYITSTKFIQLFWLIPIAMSGVLFSHTAQNTKKMNITYPAVLKVTMMGMGFIAFILIISSKYLLPLIMGLNFMPSVLPFQIILPGALFYVATIILTNYFSGNNLLKYDLIATSICFVFVLFLDLILIPQYNIIGAAIASSIAYAICGLLNIYFYCKIEKVTLSQIINADISPIFKWQ